MARQNVPNGPLNGDVRTPINNNFIDLYDNELPAKAPINDPTFTGNVNGIDKTMVGLSNVDNTSDVDKPVSTAQQAALDLKVNNAVLVGGTTQQVLVKNSSTDLDFVWENLIGEFVDVTKPPYNAVGDGITDDTQSFIDALATGKNVYVPLTGLQYVVSQPLTLSTFRQQIYGDLSTKDWGFSTGSQPIFNGSIKYTGTGALFNLTSGFNGVSNISATNETGAAFARMERSDANFDNDAEITNNSARGFETFVEAVGRGQNIHENLLFNINYGVKLELPNDTRWVSDPTEDNLIQQHPDYAWRRFNFSRNTLHNVRVRIISVTNTPYLTTPQALNGCTIKDNVLDYGFGSFEFDCRFKNGVISGNVLNRIDTTNVFNFIEGIEDTVISNNVIKGVEDATYPVVDSRPLRGIIINGIKNSTITGNVFESFNGSGIRSYSSAITENSVISNNIFNNMAINNNTDVNDNKAIVLADAYYNSICGNVVNNISNAVAGFGVSCFSPSTNEWINNIILTNSIENNGLTKIFVGTGGSSADNEIQTY